ncbi:DarT ssDNA thymidine ADP-ribosyltransferase family protein [Tenacibaculum piscium]|uniref:DarT ssDNA thymidine ADP-ribosyltransferase family protein n=1 Tax=Tenacibaculum piscium TaxID=1458515 RepID=UPI001F3209D9|nr:DarT ssDNA thymidine ADP-ribosyltransferase family protein [Tenacibaculum piscium]
MNIFRKIAKIIKGYIPFIKWGKKTNVVTFQDVQPKILKIEQKQKIEREQVLAKETKPPQKKINALTPKQEKLIEQKSEILNIIDSEEELEIFKKLNSQIELLELNLTLQRQINFNIKSIDTEKLSIISEELKLVEYSKNLIPEFKNTNKTKKTEREKKRQEIKSLKNKLFKFSLTEIHKERETRRIEKERLERERKLDEEFAGYISNSEEALNNLEFEQVTIELNSALTVRPERNNEVQQLLKNVSKIETNYKTRKAEFEDLFNKAENSFHNNELENAIAIYKKTKLLNINSLRCDKRISDAQNKIQRIKQLKEEQKRKEQAQKERREKYKDDAAEIIAYYKQNGIFNFYHYTDTRNLNSILQNNGLFSLNEMNNKDIDYQQGSETYEKADYVRLSYTQNHPLLYVSKKQGRIRQEKTLEISLDVAGLKHTKFTNVNAARTSTVPIVKIGSDLNYIKNQVRIYIVIQRNHFDLSDEEKPYYQAEVMVKDHLPLEYIMNLES